MNVSQSILNALAIDLVKINSNNGYVNIIKQSIAGYVAFGEQLELPIASYALGPEEIVSRDRGDAIATKHVQLIIEILYDTKNEAGAITDLQETLIEDVKKHFRQDTGIAAAYWSTLYNIAYITSIVLNKVYRGIEWKDLQGRISFIIDIEFTELI